jgi:hypothetical protein
MNESERRAIEWDCTQTTIRFYNRLDKVRGDEAAAMFTEDGTWFREGDDSGWTGRTAIAEHVNRLPQRGQAGVAPEDKMVFHLLTNIEVNVVDAETAEVSALTVIVPGVRSHTPGVAGSSRGVVAVFPTFEVHKKTAEGWRIFNKRTTQALRVQPAQ